MRLTHVASAFTLIEILIEVLGLIKNIRTHGLPCPSQIFDRDLYAHRAQFCPICLAHPAAAGISDPEHQIIKGL
jgi:hypothetical protein